ncbi:hypothetical protein Tco_0009717 [Tanacetum coccineum]
MTGDRSLLRNFIEKFMGTVRFGNDNFAAITGYGDYIQGNITICHVYYVENLQRFQYNTSSADTIGITSIQRRFDNLFSPMFEEYFKKRYFDSPINSAAQPIKFHKDSPSTSSIIIDKHEAPPIETTSDEQTSLISLTDADEFNQEDSADFNGNLDFIPYNASSHDEIESSTAALEPSNVQNFHQVQPLTHIWTKDHPLDQVIGDISKPVMTCQRLQIDSEVCMYALTVSTIEPKNIKEAMANHSWIESMKDERFIAYVAHKNITIFPYGRQNGFLNGPLKEEVYVSQPEGFIDPEFPDHFINLPVAYSYVILYAIELLKKHGLDECISMSTLIATERLDADLQGTPTNQTTYRYMIGGLMYLIASQPDITYATFVCARYQARLTVKHLKEVSRIFSIPKTVLQHGTMVNDLEAVSSKKQDCTSMSTTEAEYVSMSACCAQVIWMRTQLLDYGYKYNWIPMYCDSKSAIAISCNPVQHSKTKHIDIRYHFIKEHVEKGTVELYFVGTEYQLADLFTKALPKERFEYLVHRIADVHPEELYPPNKRYDLMDSNKKVDFEQVQCLPESKILMNIIKDHPLRFSIAASSQ